MATFAPPSASRTEAARPIPREPPVTSATLFSKSLCMARRHSRNGARCALASSGLVRPAAAGLLRHVFPVQVTPNLQGARWSKLAMNCAMSTLGAVSGLSLGEMAASRRIRRLALQVMREVVDIAKEKAVRMERVSGLRPDKLVSAPTFVGHAAIWLAVRG